MAEHIRDDWYQCSTCGEIKKRSEFYTDKKRKHGLSSCRDCFRGMYRKRTMSNKERLRAKFNKKYEGVDVSEIPKKTCQRCGETFPAHELFFNLQRGSEDGFYHNCVDCLTKETIGSNMVIAKLNNRLIRGKQ